MKAIAIIPGTKELKWIERDEPVIRNPDDVKLKVLEVGICGTDREISRGGRSSAPRGEKELIIGHEMLGEVEEVGKNVTLFKKGDLAVVTVRRGCGKCSSCLHERSDMCYGEDYSERGIKDLHGFQSTHVVDQEKFIVKVPASLRSCGVLCEPMSVVEKGIDELINIQRGRLSDWQDLKNKQALVVGLGPIGLLACILLRLRGMKVLAQDIVPSDSLRAKIVEEIGGTYVDGRNLKYKDMPARLGQIDLIVEAAGIAQASFHLLEALGADGGIVFTGVPEPHGAVTVPGGSMIHDLVLKNQVMLGSVNAGKQHWEHAIRDLEEAHNKWGKTISKLITSRLPSDRFEQAISEDSKAEIKRVLTWV